MLWNKISSAFAEICPWLLFTMSKRKYVQKRTKKELDYAYDTKLTAVVPSAQHINRTGMYVKLHNASF